MNPAPTEAEAAKAAPSPAVKKGAATPVQQEKAAPASQTALKQAQPVVGSGSASEPAAPAPAAKAKSKSKTKAQAKPAPTSSESGKTNLPPEKIKPGTPFPPLAVPPSPLSAEKQKRLEDLLQQYQADKVSPEEYHAARAKILAEP